MRLIFSISQLSIQCQCTRSLHILRYVISIICMAPEKIRRSIYPYGAALFFVKEKNCGFFGAVDYRAVNKINKRNSTLLPRRDDMFSCHFESRVFSKMDFKTGSDQIIVKDEDI